MQQGVGERRSSGLALVEDDQVGVGEGRGLQRDLPEAVASEFGGDVDEAGGADHRVAKAAGGPP